MNIGENEWVFNPRKAKKAFRYGDRIVFNPAPCAYSKISAQAKHAGKVGVVTRGKLWDNIYVRFGDERIICNSAYCRMAT